MIRSNGQSQYPTLNGKAFWITTVATDYAQPIVTNTALMGHALWASFAPLGLGGLSSQILIKSRNPNDTAKERVVAPEGSRISWFARGGGGYDISLPRVYQTHQQPGYAIRQAMVGPRLSNCPVDGWTVLLAELLEARKNRNPARMIFPKAPEEFSFLTPLWAESVAAGAARGRCLGVGD